MCKVYDFASIWASRSGSSRKTAGRSFDQSNVKKSLDRKVDFSLGVEAPLRALLVVGGGLAMSAAGVAGC